MAEETALTPAALNGAGSAAPTSAAGDPEETLEAEALATASREMIAAYAARHAGFAASVTIRDELPPGMMVSGSRLLIGHGTRLPRHRLHALLSHEIGVHLLTCLNGEAQGLRLFRSGLAGYEGTQEGLAVFAEHLVGGLTRARLRLIGARVVGCAAMLDGAGFVEVYRLLGREHGVDDDTAFSLTLRLFRAGGLAKDAIYLRGLLEILEHLGRGHALEPFWCGKIAAHHLPVMDELRARGLLAPPVHLPLFTEQPDAPSRLAAARDGLAPLDLID